MFKRETMSKRDRQHAAALAEDRLRYWVDQALPDTFKQAIKDRPDLMDSFVSGLARDGVQFDVARQRLAGVETRHGWHDRLAKLRHGKRYGDHYGAFQTEWFVLPSRCWVPNMSATEVGNLVRKHYGVFPEPYGTGMPEVSPSGRWFASVHWRARGSRLLVKWEHNQDV